MGHSPNQSYGLLPFVYVTRDLLTIWHGAKLAPFIGFEPTSLLQPTAFKAAPSPPGQTAYADDTGIVKTVSILQVLEL